MTVDFKVKKAPAYRVACITESGTYSDRAIRASFAKVAKWAAERKLKTGKWMFIETYGKGDSIKWNACIEVSGRAAPENGIAVKTMKSHDVVSVSFNPDEVSARVVYHAISDWVRWRRKDGTIKRTGNFREIYPGDPWKSAQAWQSMEVQLLVTKGSRKSG